MTIAVLLAVPGRVLVLLGGLGSVSIAAGLALAGSVAFAALALDRAVDRRLLVLAGVLALAGVQLMAIGLAS